MTEVDEVLLRAEPLPVHGDDEDKVARGAVVVVGGSRAVPGAALLAAVAALRAGAGRLRIAAPESIALPLGIAVPESLVVGLPETPAGEIGDGAAARLGGTLGRSDAVLVGPGMLDDEGAGRLAARLLATPGGTRFVLDAGALTRLDRHREVACATAGRLVLTPHAGEMAKLLGRERGAIEADPMRHAREAAERYGAVVALKGGTTTIAAPDGSCRRYARGRVGLATSGSGDTLAGVVAGLLARGCEPLRAVTWGVWLHGEAGNRLSDRHGPVGFLARELLDEIPSLMAVHAG